MIKLDKNEFTIIKPLLNKVTHNVPLVYSVFEGNHNGSIYVNQKPNATYALVVTNVNFLFLVGDIHESNIDSSFFDFIMNDCLEEKEMILFTFSDENRKVLDGIFKGLNVITIERNHFKFDKSLFKVYDYSDEYTIKELDENLAKKAGVEFITEGAFGVCLLKGDEIISSCYSIFIGHDEVEIDIKTNELYRNQGFGKIVASHFIETCLKKNLKPNWACWPYNQASIKLALSCGFVQEGMIPAHFWAENM